jgi:transposase InsO family protein
VPVCELPEGYGANLSLSLPRLTQPRSPTTTGKIERFHGSLRREFLDDAVPFADLAAAQPRWMPGWSSTTPPAA